MVDIARLGMRVDSTDVRTASRDLRGLERQSMSAASAIKTFAGALAIGATFRAVIRNTIEQERVTAQLEQTLRSTGRYTPELSRNLQDYASELQNVTTFGDEAIISSQALLLTFTRLGGETFPRAQEAILDVATAMGMDLRSATQQVGRALNDPIAGLGALSRAGIQFSETQRAVIREMVETNRIAEAQSIILDELETQFGGSARAARDTLGGAIQGLKNAFGDLLEGDSGGDGVRGAKEAIEELTAVLSDPKMQESFQTLVNSAISVATNFAKATAEVVNFTQFLGEHFGRLVHGSDNPIGQVDERIEHLQGRLRDLIAEINRPRWNRTNPFISTENIGQQIYEIRKELEALESTRAGLIQMEMAAGTGTANSPAARERVNVEALGGATEDLAEANNKAAEAAAKLWQANQDTVERLQMEAETLGWTRTEIELYKLELEGATDAQVQAAASALALVDAYDMQAEAARNAAREQQAANREAESIRQQMLTAEEAIKESYERRRDIVLAAEYDNEEARTQLLERLERDRNERLIEIERERITRVLEMNQEFFGGLAGLTKAFAGEQSGIYRAMFAVEQGFAIAKALMNAPTAFSEAYTATVGIPVIGPALAPAAGAAAAAAQVAQAGAIRSITPSFDGGGHTGYGPRAGGIDGKGGFLATLHPNETVVDHTKGQSMGTVVNIHNAPAGTTTRTRNEGGREVIDVILADLASDGPASKALRSTYGMKRVGK